MTSSDILKDRELVWLDRGRVPCLDGLRALSILLVLIEHASLTHAFPLTRQVHLGHLGQVGVSMFFAISGFLITLLLSREWNRSGTVSLSGFYRRRALRILPAYVAFVVVVFVLTRIEALTLTRVDWLGVLTYTVNFIEAPTWDIGHIWSLSVEEQFYLLWPFLVMWLSPRRALTVVGAYLVLMPLVRVGIWASPTDELWLIEYLTPLRMDALAAGCALALLARRADLRERLTPTPRQALLITVVATVMIAASYIAGDIVTAYDRTFRYSVVALCLCGIIWSVATQPQMAIGRLLETRPFVFIGVLSYSLYLWQQPFLNPRNGHWIAAWPTNLLFAIVTALASYYVIERPFLRIKDRAHTAARAPQDLPAAETATQGA